MTEREKLVELIRSIQDYGCKTVHEKNSVCAKILTAETVAYFLIANGVTVQEMIPITEEVPDENCLAVNGCGTYMVGKIVKDPYLSAVTGYSCMRDGIGIANVTHWISLPKAKKEEQP